MPHPSRPSSLPSLFPAALLTLAALFVAGCQAPLVEEVTNFWSLSCCGSIAIILDIIALVELAGSSRSTGSKLLWAALIVIFPYLGCLLYYVFGRRA